ncbi:hypothetical protein BC835DRAFT_1291206 [Cytidiella melzeri]|nr:hypothetical protein BC835DRAFT_1291206 [Cytidiella melzeri]
MCLQVSFSNQSSRINLKAANGVGAGDLYGMVLVYLQRLWQNNIVLVPEMAPSHIGELFIATSVKSYTYVTVDGLRYRAATKQRGHPHQLAYINGREPVQIEWILAILHVRNDSTLPAAEHTCAVVRRFVHHANTPEMPWDLRYALPPIVQGAAMIHIYTGPMIWRYLCGKLELLKTLKLSL